MRFLLYICTNSTLKHPDRTASQIKANTILAGGFFISSSNTSNRSYKDFYRLPDIKKTINFTLFYSLATLL